MFKAILVFMLSLFTGFFSQAALHAQNCSGIPNFISKVGFDPARTALSTSERRQIGLVMIELPKNIDNIEEPVKGRKIYSHPSWDDQGYLSSITFDREGNIYVAPKPNVNMLHTNEDNLSTVYQIDSETGVMKAFFRLPLAKGPNNQNPYGILGLTYDCLTDHLLISTVAGSDQTQERGKVYALNVNTKQLLPLVKNMDVMGLCLVAYPDGRRELLLASARESLIFALPINKELNVLAPARKAIQLEGLGPRGDDKGRKLVSNKSQLEIYGTPFYYNLSAPSQSNQNKYLFRWNELKGFWELVRVERGHY